MPCREGGFSRQGRTNGRAPAGRRDWIRTSPLGWSPAWDRDTTVNHYGRGCLSLSICLPPFAWGAKASWRFLITATDASYAVVKWLGTYPRPFRSPMPRRCPLWRLGSRACRSRGSHFDARSPASSRLNRQTRIPNLQSCDRVSLPSPIERSRVDRAEGVTDSGTVRKVTPLSVVSTVVGQPGAYGNVVGPLPAALGAVVAVTVIAGNQIVLASDNALPPGHVRLTERVIADQAVPRVIRSIGEREPRSRKVRPQPL
jgi:hypothetical protein